MHLSQHDRRVEHRLPLIGRFSAGFSKCSERLVELPALLVADAEIHADIGILADGESAFVVVDGLRILRRIHIEVAELHQRIEVARIPIDRLFERSDLLSHGFHRIACWLRRTRLRRRGRRRPTELPEPRTDQQRADDEAEQEAADGVDD